MDQTKPSPHVAISERSTGQPPGAGPLAVGTDGALEPPDECLWECGFCRMVVSTHLPGFVPDPHYAGDCSRNPDAGARNHYWRTADTEP
jgi:hypothetical protein